MPTVGPRPVVILRPAPQRVDRIFTPAALERLRRDYEVVDLEDATDEAAFDAALPSAFAVVGQPDLPAERLARAPRLRAVMNVEGNFFPNVDYEACFRGGVHVLGCGPAYAQAVAEYALGLAIDLARGISREDRAFRAGRERYVSAGNADAILMRHARIGLVGYGNLGRALHSAPRPVRRHDPCLRPVAAGRDPARGRARAVDPRRGPGEQRPRVRPRHRHGRERAAARPAASSSSCPTAPGSCS